MSRRQLKTDDELGFLMATYDDQKENERLFDCRIEMRVLPAAARGHFHINVYAYQLPYKAGDEPYASATQPYPTPHALRLHAGLYRAMIRMGGELARLAQARLVAEAQATSESR